ncbi:MAG TPA: hypothetical protein VK700_10705 [Steroidobacteraceae bacterium]|jgi:hypothetical protein|nr:hypothetical protein [Steroidobacteraceae bacterium]
MKPSRCNGLDTRLRCAGALCLLLCCTAAAAVSPAAGSDEVRSLHPPGTGELQLQFSSDVAGQDLQTISAGLSKDYDYVADQHGLRLHDYQLRRVYSVDPDKHFFNNSLFAEVWFRVAELENRVALRKSMQAAGLPMDKDPNSQDPFWMESGLGVVSEKLPRPSVQRSVLDGRTRWEEGGAEVVAVRYDAEPVPEAVRGGLRRFWASFVHIHPLIADDLAATGQVPQELWVMAQRPGKDPVVMHWKLTRRQWRAQAPFPLPPHLSAAAAVPAWPSVFPDIFALLSREVANHAVPPAQDVYVSRAEGAIDRGAGLEALVTVLEMNLARGPAATACMPADPRPFCALVEKAGPLFGNDPRYAIAFARQSPDLSERAQFDSLPNAYLLRLLWATRPPGKGIVREATERDLLAALNASPVVNFTKDTGDFYIGAWEPFAAWQVWDLGRLMAGHVSDDLLRQINSLEDQLYVGVPSLF